MKLESPRQARLQRRPADFAVALGGVPVASREQGALVPDREIDRRPGDQFLVVEIAAVLARLDRRDAPVLGLRRHPEVAEEGAERQIASPGQPPDHRCVVEWDVNVPGEGKFIGQRATEGAD